MTSASPNRNRQRGFTLVEMLTVVAIVGVLAALAYGIERAASRNASLSRATFDVVLRTRQLKSEALRWQQDILFVMVDAANADACSWSSSSSCAQYFILRNPMPAWTLASFDPNNPGMNLDPVDCNVDSYTLPAGVKFYATATGTPPAPFTIPLGFFEATMWTTCGTRSCFAIRFRRDGDVWGELAAGNSSNSATFAAALTTNLLDPSHIENNATDRKGILFAFPSGIVRSFPVF